MLQSDVSSFLTSNFVVMSLGVHSNKYDSLLDSKNLTNNLQYIDLE